MPNTLGDTLAAVFSRYDPQRMIPKATKPTNEDLWRQRLSGQGAITKPEPSLGDTLARALTGAQKAVGVSDRRARHVAGRATSFLNDATPVGNVLGAEAGGKQFARGVTRGDVGQAALGAGVFGLSMLPFAGKARKPLNSLMYDASGAIRKYDDLSPVVQEDIAYHIGDLAGEDGRFVGETLRDLIDPVAVDQLSLPPSSILSSKATSPLVVSKYAAMRSPAPPVMVENVGGQWRLLEGGHRHAAALAQGAPAIDVVDVTPFRQANWRAFLEGETDSTMPLWSQIAR